jgi:hypothetical protein
VDIYVQATIGQCAEFVLDGKKQVVSVVISPLTITSGETVLKVKTGCNMWKACQNLKCQFSQVAYGPKKAT